MLTPAAIAAPPLMLWSASNALKYRISYTHFGSHYVWCSPAFEGAALPRFAAGHAQPPSSDPARIYRALHADVAGGDRHSGAVAQARKSLKEAALIMLAAGKIAPETAADVTAIVDAAEIAEFRPVLYAIPAAGVWPRTKIVPFDKRASSEPEYIVEDLRNDEFHVIEPMLCP